MKKWAQYEKIQKHLSKLNPHIMCGSPWDCQETLQVLSSQDCTPSTASIPRYAYLFERKLLRIPWRACIVDLASFFKDNFAHLSVKGLPVWLEQMFHHTHIGNALHGGVPPDRFNANKLLPAKFLEGKTSRIVRMHLMVERILSSNLECLPAKEKTLPKVSLQMPCQPFQKTMLLKQNENIYIYIYIYICA